MRTWEDAVREAQEDSGAVATDTCWTRQCEVAEYGEVAEHDENDEN